MPTPPSCDVEDHARLATRPVRGERYWVEPGLERIPPETLQNL